jgi:hypothetical protein
MTKLKSVLEKFNTVKQSLADEKKKGGDLYNNDAFFKPQVVKGEERTMFRVRFLDVAESPTGRPWISYKYHMFTREGDNKYIKVLDPRTIDPGASNPIADLAKRLFDSDNSLDQALAKKLYSKPRHYTLVYVKEAPENQKQYVGKVLIFEIGVKLYRKLEMNIGMFEKCFWDPYKGCDFLLMMTKAGQDEWANYDDSAFIGQDGPISTDEKVMEFIGSELERIKIKDIVLGKEKVKSGAELLELLEGGKEKSAKHDSRPAKELVSGETVSTVAAELDFGDVVTKAAPAPTAKVEVASKPIVAPEEPKKTVETKEVGSDIDDFDISFTDDELKL